MATQRSPEEFKRAYEHHKSQGNAEAAKRVASLYRQSQTTQPKAKDGAFEGYGDAFMRGIDQPLENMGVTAEALGAKGLGESLKGAVDERPGQSASGQFMNADKDGTFAYRYLPKAAVEQAGQFAGSLLARAGGAAVGGAVGNVPGAIAGGLAGPMMFEFAQQLGPIALERAKNNGRETPNKEDWTYATGTSAGVGALNAIAPGATGKIKRMFIEGVTEGTQSVGEQVGSTVKTDKGLEVDPRQALAEGIIGGTSAGMVDTSVSTAKAAANLVRGTNRNSKAKSEDVSEEEMQAKASFAQTLASIAEEEKLDLTNIDRTSTKGARQAVDLAHKRLVGDLKARIKDLKPLLAVTDQDTLSELEDKIFANLAQDEARTKVKNKVGSKEKQAFVKLAGNTYEGAKALNLMLQLDELTEIHAEGYKGGVSRVTDQLAPLGLGGEGYDVSRANAEQIFRPLLSTGLAAQTGGLSLIPQAAIFGGGRLIDKARGGRSRVQAYVNANQGNPGQTLPSESTSLRNQNIAAQEAIAAQEEEARLRQEQYTEEERQANLRRVQQGAPPQQGSPEDIMRDATGLDRSGLAQVIRILKANPNTLPATTRAIEAYETSVATGGQVDFGLYRDINALVDQYPQLQKLMVRPRNAQSAAQGQAQQQLSQKEQNYQRGIDNNRAEAARITEAVNQDKTIEVQHKAHLLSTLEEMQLDLGLNPVGRLQTMQKRLEEKGVPGPTVEKYLGQYLQRVMAQQGAKAERDAAQDDVMEIDESREPSFTSISSGIDLGDMGSNPMRVSPSYPQGAKTTLDALAQNLQIGLGAVKNDPVVMQKIATKLRTYTPVTGDQAKNDSDFLEQALEFYKGNLLALFDSVSPEYRDRAKLWYVGANKLAQEAAVQYSLPVEAVSGVYASLSPQQDWYVNYDIGMRTIDIFVNHQDTVFDDGIYNDFTNWIHGKYPSGKNKGKFIRPEKARKEMQIDADLMKNKSFKDLSTVQQGFFVRFWDQANNVERGHRVVTPEGGFADFARKQNGEKTTKKWNSFGPIVKSLEILKNPSRENINVQLGDMHKVRSFYNNILDPLAAEGDVTIDTHAIAAALLRPLAGSHIEVLDNFGAAGNSKNFGVFGSYGVFAEAYRRAASEVGVQPREMQSITWEAVRGLFPKTAKGAKQQAAIKSIWKQYENGTISAVEARKKVYEESGNIRAAQWENDRPNFEAPTVERSSGNAGNVPSLRSPGGDGRGDRSNAPGGVPQPSQEVNLSAVPGSGALTQPESPQIPFDFTAPSVGQIKDKLEDAKGAVQMVIGKPGTKFENGLSSMEDFKQLADMLNVSVGIFDSQKEFMEKYSVTKGTRGLYGSNKGGVSGQIAILANGIESDLLYTTAHESAHPLESRPASNEEAPLLYDRKLSGRHPKASSVKRNVYANSLRAKLRGKYGSDPVIQAEIDKLQDGTIVSIANRPDLPGRPIRLNLGQTYEMFRDENPQGSKGQALLDAQNSFPDYQGYMKGDGEFAVDPVMFYLINPKAMKKDMPNTFKFMQKHFNESNIPIKIYASPLATIMAILMAGMIGGEEEEEEENPGILTPGPGMLSA